MMVCVFLLGLNSAKKSKDGEKPDWAKKNLQDYSDADLERLLDQWDEDEEPIPPDELPDGHPDKAVGCKIGGVEAVLLQTSDLPLEFVRPFCLAQLVFSPSPSVFSPRS